MGCSFGVLLVLLCALSLGSSNLFQLARMMRCMTKRSPLIFYNGYGCYCGVGGSRKPVDETDWCCQAHDCCYGKLEEMGCRPKHETYIFRFGERGLMCGGRTKCQKLSCECDKTVSICLQKATYNPRYIFYLNFLCKGSTPRC